MKVCNINTGKRLELCNFHEQTENSSEFWNHVTKFSMWQHHAMGHGVKFVVPGTIC